jgi:hypothetical protein
VLDEEKMKIFATLIAVLISVALFGFFVSGGFERFQAPIRILVPAGYTGVICAKVLADGQGSHKGDYVVDENGHTAIEGDVLRSHRQKQWAKRGPNTSTTPLSNSEITAVRTERDARTGHSYMVYWLGQEAEWKRHAESSSAFCVPKQG